VVPNIYERVDAMGYDERRATLRHFMAQVTLWTRDQEPWYAIGWAFDFGNDWWQPTVETEDFSWVNYMMESRRPRRADLGFSSSGRSVNRNTPVVRLRWTDRDLVALAAD
jgi:hypothetical protein